MGGACKMSEKRSVLANKQTDDRLKSLFSELQGQSQSLDQKPVPVEPEKDSCENKNNLYTSNAKVKISICPCLKAAWDTSIRYGYPDEQNYCFKPKKARPVSLIHQEQVCITAQFYECPIYSQSAEKIDGIGFIHKIFKWNESAIG
jgi:hypothetical protein